MHIPKADSSFQTALAPGLPPCSSGMGNASCLPPCCSLALDFDLRCTIDMTCDAAAAAASAATDASPACFEEDSYGWCEHGLYGSMNFDEPTTNGGLELCKAGCAAQAECGGMYYGACSAEEAFCPNEMQHCGYCNTSYTISLPPESLGYSSTNFRSFRKVACAGATFTAEAGAHAEGWPCKNGNLNRTGCTPAIAAPAALLAPPTWRWHSEYPNDIVRATPLIDSAGGIYLSTVTSGRVVKLSKAGVEVWRWSASGTPHAQGPSADASADPLPAVPTLMGGALYTITGSGKVISLDTTTGAERWRTDTNDAASGDTFSMAAGLGYVVTATVGSSGCQGECRVIALDPSTGAIVWTFDVGVDESPGDKADNGQRSAEERHDVISSVQRDGDVKPVGAYNMMVALVECATHGKVAVFSNSVGKVYKLDLATGELLWTTDALPSAGFTTGGAIVGPDDTVYAVSNLGATVGFESLTVSHTGVVSAHALSTGALKWRIDLGLGNEANSAPSIGPISGRASRLALVVAVGINPAVPQNLVKPADGTSGAPRRAYTLALDPSDGSLLWNYTMPLWHGAAAGDSFARVCLPDSSANVAIDGTGTVFIPHEDGLVYGIRDANGDGAIGEGEVRSYDLGNALQGSPAIVPGMLVVAPCNGVAAWIK